MSLNFRLGQRVIVSGSLPLIDRLAIIDSLAEVASHWRDASGQAPTVYRVVFERSGAARWVLPSRLQACDIDARTVVPWSDCPWQPDAAQVAFIEGSGLWRHLLQLRRALASLRPESRP